ncbi:MAG: DMT family transporter [Chloroflexaceae bacterium]|jgi:drug/metabolite transporter (DMT)-like permease|nr:DMT family transporter [Chloroflexaceae bacterium]
MLNKNWVPYVVLAIGVLVVSSAAILVRLAQDLAVPSLTIAAGRLGLAALILTPLAWRSAGPELRQLPRRDMVLAGAAGLFLALHFAAWVSSLAYTSVASSAALVATNPLWVALASLLLFRERLRLSVAVAVGLTLLGTLCILWSDGGTTATSNPLLGNALALLGALTVTGYFLIGRDLRRRMSLLCYIWLVYSSAAVTLGLVALVSGQQILGFPPVAYLLLLALALGPQLLGHTAFNWSLRYLSATFVTIAILGEPVGAALLALLLFNETFAPFQLAGFVLLLLGIGVAALGEQQAASSPPASAPEPLPSTQPAETR